MKRFHLLENQKENDSENKHRGRIIKNFNEYFGHKNYIISLNTLCYVKIITKIIKPKSRIMACTGQPKPHYLLCLITSKNLWVTYEWIYYENCTAWKHKWKMSNDIFNDWISLKFQALRNYLMRKCPWNIDKRFIKLIELSLLEFNIKLNSIRWHIMCDM